MFPPRAESVDSFSPSPATRQPETAKRTSESRKPFGGLSRRGMIAGLAVLPAALPAAAAGADAELVALGAKFEPLVGRFYARQAVWSRALSQAAREHITSKVEATGYEMPPIFDVDDNADDGEEV